ncbi:hypothetical protein LTR56_010308 [Elasticomyces elasticus]|nr:hypothetical protein LTR56_010308 [Elasticomyces elasticus]KAK3658254.1 hypothetical protein LTR22_008955 [Elasticomyces elasticus]KAK4922985.1 hypothetical protein LTR49_009816 [Elasticomyces elasticus]KAK5747694.1 hypothetical protein LTS12_022243 [Elasticomyces elasticus]
MPFTLARLPTELLEMIAMALAGDFAQAYSEEGQVICRLRSTCREALDKLDTKFFSTYFASRDLWLDQRKLAELDLISQRPELADRITELTVFCQADSDDIDDAFEAGRSLIAPGGTASTLTVTLRRLANLGSLEFVDMATEETPPLATSHNIGSSFAAVMLALESCKCTLRSLASIADTSPWRVVGMLEARTLLCLSPSLAMLERLDLSILCAPTLTGKAANGLKKGSELAIALQRCPQLKNLSLRLLFAPEASVAFAALASMLILPKLQSFQLWQSSCTMNDLGIFLLNHAATVRNLSLTTVVFHGGSPAAVTDLLDLMQKSMTLNTIEVSHLKMCATNGYEHTATIGFPGINQVMFGPEPEADDFMFIDTFLLLERAEGLNEELAQMKECVVYTAF